MRTTHWRVFCGMLPVVPIALGPLTFTDVGCADDGTISEAKLLFGIQVSDRYCTDMVARNASPEKV